MLEEMDAGQIAEWKAFWNWEAEMEERSRMQAKAEAGVNQMRKPR